MQIAKRQARTTSKCVIAKYAQVFSTSNITPSQRTKTIFFLIVPAQYYWPLLRVSRFFYSLNQRSQARHNLFSNIREVPAKTSKCRKIRIVAGRRFRRFLLVNQLPLSIMAVHAQYRATDALSW